jgi:hypothetical protein
MTVTARLARRYGNGCRRGLAADLRPLGKANNPFVDAPRPDAWDAQRVTPHLVDEVAFTQWTEDDGCAVAAAIAQR